ncbi:MAG: helix-turn-helix domain-containing protein [Candidatus Gracilibacteria bacterium]|nr:helix-turn-helix domain-containing protein [Candidatus Gracilibacteria bacterium]
MEKCKCSVLGFFDFLSKKWVLLIIKGIGEGAVTFTDIKKYLGGINAKIISERLTELEEGEFIRREIISTKPIKIRYTLTEKGISLSKEIENIDKWMQKWGEHIS